MLPSSRAVSSSHSKLVEGKFGVYGLVFSSCLWNYVGEPQLYRAPDRYSQSVRSSPILPQAPISASTNRYADPVPARDQCRHTAQYVAPMSVLVYSNKSLQSPIATNIPGGAGQTLPIGRSVM